jgi:hypothetical protein
MSVLFIFEFNLQLKLPGRLKLHVTRWAKIFQENYTWEKCTKILIKVQRFKIQGISYMLCVIKDWFLSIYHHISTAMQ